MLEVIYMFENPNIITIDGPKGRMSIDMLKMINDIEETTMGSQGGRYD